LLKRIIDVAPLFLPRVGIAPTGAKNMFLIAPFGASFDSGKNNGVLTQNVSRKRHEANG